MSVGAFRIPGGSLDDLISRFFGGDPFAGRPVERVDLSRLLSTESRQLLQRAAEQAAASGSPYRLCCVEDWHDRGRLEQ